MHGHKHKTQEVLMTHRYRIALALLALLLAAALTACANSTAAQPASTPAATDGPSPSPAQEMPEAQPSPGAQALASLPAAAECPVTQVAAYYFADVQGSPNLYAAVEFQNSSDYPAVVSSVTVTFTVDGKTVEETFTPPCAQSDIIAPGETSTAAGWFSCSPKAPESVTATAKVVLTPVPLPQQMPLAVTNLMIVQNYPGFATVSGRAKNLSPDEDYDLTMIYLNFYDGEGKLLGVQFFTKDLIVKAGDVHDFVYHLRCLPIEGLTANTAAITARGFGIG